MNSTPEPTEPAGFSQPSPYKPVPSYNPFEHTVFTPVEEIARGDRVKVNGVEREVTCVHLDERRGTAQVCLDNDWEPNFITTGIGVNIEQVVSHSGMDSEPDADEPADSNEVPESLAAGGWCAPSDVIFSTFPEITVKRGGISFTAPTSMRKQSKAELRAEVEKLHTIISEERARRYKAQRKVKRLLKIIKKVA